MSMAAELKLPIEAFFVENPPVPTVANAWDKASTKSIPAIIKRIVWAAVKET